MAISIYNWTKDTGTTSASFDAWVAAQGSTPRSLSIGTDITVTGNLTLPSTIDITTITNNAKFTGSGKTLIINKMSAQPRHQIFDTGLNVLFASGATTYILPEWFGSGNGNVCFGSGINTPLTKVYVEGGVAIGTNLAAGSGNLYVAGSGAFTGVVHGATPTVDTHLVTKLYNDTASGALNTKINNSGALIAQKVPYTGASGNVNLGTNNLTLDKVYFNPNPTVGAHQSGKLYYDLTWDTLTANIGRDVNLQIGQEEMRRVYNNSSGTILNGHAVYTNGTYNAGSNDVATVALACANNVNTYWVLGLATQNIASGQYGMITVRGHINDVDTSSWNNGDVLYLSDTSSGNLTTSLPSAGNYKVRVGRVITSNATTGRINVRLLTASKLGDLANVTAPTPTLDDVLRFNGTEWVNGVPVTSSASTGIEFFMDDTTITPTGTANSIKIHTLSKTPVITPEDVDTINVTSATSPVIGEAYLYNTALGRSLLDGGVWTFNTYASVSSTSAGRISSIKRSVYAVVVSSGTLSTSGTGTSRTVYSYNSSAFVSGDIGADKTYTSFVQTPTGLYQMSGFLNASSSTIIVPSTYVNETGVAYSKWKYLFQTETPTITSLTTNYSIHNTTVAASGISINTTDKLGEIVFGISNNTTSIYFTHNGTDHYSHFETPLITLHNNLAGLQGGAANDYYHLTASEKAQALATSSIGTGSSGYIPKFVSTSGIGNSTIYNDGALVGIGATPWRDTLEVSGNFSTRVSADTYSTCQIYSSSHDNISINLDSYVGLGSFRSSDAGSNFRFYKFADVLRIQYASGIAGSNTIDVWNDTPNSNTAIGIKANGNVGINTINPLDAFDVNGNIRASGTVTAATPTADTHLATKLYVDTASGALNTRINNSGAYAANVSGQLSARILSNQVTGTGSSGYLPKFISTSGIGNSNIYESGDNISIGTTTPSGKLHVSGSTNSSIYLSRKDNSDVAVWAYNSGTMDFGTVNADNICFKVNSLNSLFIGSAAGNYVGVGTTNPLDKFDVNGNIRASGNLHLGTSSGVLYSDALGDIRVSTGFNGTIQFVE